MRERHRLTRRTPVAACDHLLEIEPLLVGVGDDLIGIMRRAARQPATRLIGVVDANGVLIGSVPILRLAEALIVRVAPEALMSGLVDVADIAEFGHVVGARTAGDIMLPTAGIAAEATIEEAFRVMHRRRLSGLHVVGPDGRPTGYLDLLELTLVYVEALESTGDEPSGLDSSPPR